jgi:hypothetical protein
MAAAFIGALAFNTIASQAADPLPSAVTAIDILLEPDATMLQRADATGVRLRRVPFTPERVKEALEGGPPRAG